MCVIVAKKLKLKNSEKENWFLYKIRDRNYSPEYKLEVEKKGTIETLFLIDQINTWSESVNSNGLMIVSAALDNHTDLDDDGTTFSDREATARQIDKTKTLRSASAVNSVKDAVKILTKDKFIGTSFISDGDKLTILEIYVNSEAWQREIDKFDQKKFEKMSPVDQDYKIMEGIKDEDYDVELQEIKKDTQAVRTNHGRLLPKAGYQKNGEDTKGYTSSMLRDKYTRDSLNNLGDDAHPFDIMTALKNLTGCDKEPQNCPIRVKGKKDKDGNIPYYTSTIVMLTPTGTMFAIPLDSSVGPKSSLRLKPNRKVDFVLLPKNLPLFEGLISRAIGFKGYNNKNKENRKFFK